MPRQIDIDLLKAVVDKKKSEMIVLIAQGANPFAIIDSRNAPNSGYNIFIQILSYGSTDVLIAALEYAYKIRTINYEPLDLNKIIFTSESVQMNTFQFACLHSGNTALKALDAYAQNTGQTTKMRSILNSSIIQMKTDTPGFTMPLGEFLTREFSCALLLDNFCYDGADQSANKVLAAQHFISRWAYAEKEDRLLPFTGPIEILWYGPMKTLDIALRLGLDLTATCTTGDNLPGLLGLMCDWSKNLDDSKVLIELLMFHGAKVLSAPQHNKEGKVFFHAMVSNRLKACPIEFKITLDFEPMYDLVQRYKNAVETTNPMLTTVYRQQQEAADKLAKLKSEVQSLSQKKLQTIRGNLADHPHVLNCFNVVHQRIENHFAARKIATTRIFDAKATTNHAMIAITTQTLFAAVAENVAVPFAGIISDITGALVIATTKAHANTQSSGVFEATLGLDTDSVVIDIAAIITSEAMKCCGDKIDRKLTERLAKEVIKAIDLLHKSKPQNSLQLVALLASPAIAVLAKTRVDNSSSYSPASNNNGSNDLYPALQNGKTAKPGCCVLM